MTTYEDFVRAWHKTSQPLQKIGMDAVSEFEMTVGVALPADYKVAITEVGLPRI